MLIVKKSGNATVDLMCLSKIKNFDVLVNDFVLSFTILDT